MATRNTQQVNDPLPCIACGKRLEPAVTNGVTNQPNSGTVFVSNGNYGSTVWDPFDLDDFLEVNVCDACLVQHKDRVLQGRRLRRTEMRYRDWEPA